MLIDTHAHINFKDFKDDYHDVIGRALKNDIWMINVGSQFSTSQRAVELAGDYEKGIYAAVGLHPVHLSSHLFHDKVDNHEDVEFTPQAEKFEKEKYLKLAKNKKVLAIGEIGLDYFHNQENEDLQKEIFSQQIDLALELDLPIIVHCRDAYRDTLEILKEKKRIHGKKLRGIAHSFLGKLSYARGYVEMDFFLGFNGIITFARDYDKVLKEIGIENMVVETDCPYLAPMPFRGKRNEPLYVQYVAEKIAEIKDISIQEVSEKTTKNAKNLLDLG